MSIAKKRKNFTREFKCRKNKKQPLNQIIIIETNLDLRRNGQSFRLLKFVYFNVWKTWFYFLLRILIHGSHFWLELINNDIFRLLYISLKVGNWSWFRFWFVIIISRFLVLIIWQVFVGNDSTLNLDTIFKQNFWKLHELIKSLRLLLVWCKSNHF